jgi:hypothetical protein
MSESYFKQQKPPLYKAVESGWSKAQLQLLVNDTVTLKVNEHRGGGWTTQRPTYVRGDEKFVDEYGKSVLHVAAMVSPHSHDESGEVLAFLLTL